MVAPGETLWQIAAALTGDPHRWPELYRANRDQIKDPSLLYPGQRLAIPDLAAAPGGAPPARSPGPDAPPGTDPRAVGGARGPRLAFRRRMTYIASAMLDAPTEAGPASTPSPIES